MWPKEKGKHFSFFYNQATIFFFLRDKEEKHSLELFEVDHRLKSENYVTSPPHAVYSSHNH